MLVLAIDTSTPDLITGIIDSDSGATLAERVVEDTRAHNEQLTPMVQEALAEAGVSFGDLNAVVVGCGPGPFTGLRVGMVSAAAFGDALGIPVHGVCSLDAIAAGIDWRRYSSALVATDARRREIYYATYRAGVRRSGPDVVAPGALVLEEDVDVVVIPQHLVEKLPAALVGVDTQRLRPTTAHLLACADLEETPGPLVPMYLRRPDAKEPRPRPTSAAIPEVRP
ncbi:tRNA (adenosine(37)-N6)-threonylcarbamoyltransferase complex dimerization subunit type 1 TsaB [Corynebacterium pacaense]|uniref:tRNA (adenosine(37)-N6)-threonylcarbamoyltransferase complex dimerization subunit type 1 TsaB n=1 Tax=Corynebacterium pacaense TaxID=1816684 RepID=UPI0009B94306|nr:tRNA (adenosine(37)-N6)-threonylcarbamoyltransferase complex dimerization subunit type 1 TsaB [Corynebacterium pacaense]